MKKLEDLSRIDTSLAPVLETLKSAAIGVEEASYSIRDYLDRLEADPDRLEQVESRIDLIHRLKRKYGSSLEEVLAFLENVRAQIAAADAILFATPEYNCLDGALKTKQGETWSVAPRGWSTASPAQRWWAD